MSIAPGQARLHIPMFQCVTGSSDYCLNTFRPVVAWDDVALYVTPGDLLCASKVGKSKIPPRFQCCHGCIRLDGLLPGLPNAQA